MKYRSRKNPGPYFAYDINTQTVVASNQMDVKRITLPELAKDETHPMLASERSSGAKQRLKALPGM